MEASKELGLRVPTEGYNGPILNTKLGENLKIRFN